MKWSGYDCLINEVMEYALPYLTTVAINELIKSTLGLTVLDVII